jgi:hypothetical protein
MSTFAIDDGLVRISSPRRPIAAFLAATLWMAGASAFAGTGPSAFAADIVFSVQDNPCDPYAPGSGCTPYSSLAGSLELTVSDPSGETAVKTVLLSVDGESTEDKHKGEITNLAVNPGTALSLSFAGGYQSLGDPQPATHPLFAFAPGVAVGPAQGVPHAAPQIELGTLKSGAFDAFTLGGSLYAFGGTAQVGTWTASVTPSVPEPGRWALTGLGVALVGIARRKALRTHAA